MKKILLIEDDKQLSMLVQDFLQKYGYDVNVPSDFQHIIEQYHSYQPELVLLDINLPYYDGYYLCRSIRQISNVPIIIISARNADMDQILAIELGADDYITKPFTFDILHSKIKATVRRVYGEYAEKDGMILEVGPLKINSQTMTIAYQGTKLELSKNEFLLLKKMVEQHNAYIPREVLMEEVWDTITFVDDNTLTVNITRIKKKLATLGLHDVISSKRGVGYRLNVSVGN
ncbi:response regulator transcription factor [Sutcliffiella rhizosphaerae]|uniref:Response regulator protein GraR n=1 Tax=Sutcliffiella rhizosphaerae TaxID=2880967 RepID=A0ABN8AAS9_9BACI|nr:response regulator transcription factor [Sutcliffiella rhizosphaerae]CAG9621574.1 Response regulator protein GraR [Sutcliffiella rhizosphaerae]